MSSLIMLPVPISWVAFKNGGPVNFWEIRTKYGTTYVKDLKGPWLLYDNEKDPFQDDNW